MSKFFQSARRTLARANHHIMDLKSHIDAFTNEKPWSYVVEKDPDGFHELHKIRFTRWLPDDLSGILFDAANNLRAVLDQLGYASAIASGKIEPKSAFFPFGDDADGIKNVIGRGRCKDLPPEILALFLSAKPYKGGNDALWALNKLCNTKKHCALIPLQAGTAALKLRPESAGFYGLVRGPISAGSPRWDSEKYELLLLRTDPKANVHYNANVALSVAIEGVDTLSGKPAVGVLGLLSEDVADLGAATEAECHRIGLI